MAANYEVGNIELNIKSTATDSVSAFQEIIDKINEMKESIDKVTGGLKGVQESTKDLTKAIKEPKKEMTELDKEVDKLGKTSEKTGDTLKKALTFGGALIIAKKLTRSMTSGIEESAEMIQNYRLLQVASREYFTEALDFQSQLASSFGVNSKDAMGVQGYFATLTSSLGIANREASSMSETLTKLTFDLGSFFGEDYDSMYTKLQSGLIGQTKPLRSLGIDVTQQTIQGYLDGMGLDVLVQDLNQAEKVLLRYIAILDQSRISHGNLAYSIEMPAQQIQVLKAQIKELGMWMTNVFMGTIGRVLPYINAFVMALKEMMKALAMLFGFELSNYSFGKDQMASSAVGADNLSKSVGGVGKAADKSGKKIKKMLGLMGFNEIHNVQTPPEDSGSLGGGGGGGLGDMGGGVYDDLLGKLSEYDNMMGDVRMKAMDIRDRLLEWLGFLFDINELGEIVNLKWGGLSEMATSAKILFGIIGGIIGFKIYGKLAKLFKLISGSGMAKLIAGFVLEVKKGGFIPALLMHLEVGLGLLIPVLSIVAGGAALVGGTFKAWSFGKAIGETDELGGNLDGLFLSVGSAAAGGALLGSVIPVIGTAAGAIIGTVVGLTAAVAGWGFSKPIEEISKFNDVSNETVQKMKPFEESFKGFDNFIKELDWTNSVISGDDVERVRNDLETMGNYLNTEIVAKAEETKKKLQEGDIFQDLDPNARGELVAQIEEASIQSQAKTTEMTDKINAIVKQASDEGRELKESEVQSINALQDEMYKHGVKTLSASQKDQETILLNLKTNSTKLSAQQASEMVKTAVQNRDDIIKEAQGRYADEVRIANDLEERGIIDKNQRNEMLANAEKFRDNEIENASQYHDDIIREAKEHSGEYINHIDWETGEVKNRFQASFGNIKDRFTEFREDWSRGWNKISGDVKGWFNNHIAPWFTADKWNELFTRAKDGLVRGWNNTISWFRNNVKFPKLTIPPISFPKITLPTFSLAGKFSLAPPSVPRIGVNWKSFKDGGFPDGENGAFFANDREMVGKFTNGKTAVANNDQIVKGIQQGVEKGVLRAMAEPSNNGDSGDTNIYLDSRLISKHMNKRELELEMVRG